MQNRVPHLGMWDLGRDGTKREGSSQVIGMRAVLRNWKPALKVTGTTKTFREERMSNVENIQCWFCGEGQGLN